MSIPTALSQLKYVESVRQGGVLLPSKTLAIAISQLGSPTSQKLICGTLEQLAEADKGVYGEPLHSLIIVGKRLHDLEVEFADDWALRKGKPDDQSLWRSVAKDTYGVKMDD
jgi:diphthine synthase